MNKRQRKKLGRYMGPSLRPLAVNLERAAVVAVGLLCRFIVEIARPPNRAERRVWAQRGRIRITGSRRISGVLLADRGDGYAEINPGEVVRVEDACELYAHEDP